jgi:RIO kinase 2
MVRLDTEMLRFLTKDHFRTLAAVEQGMRNHAIVPTRLVAVLASIKSASIHDILGQLAKFKLIRHTGLPYDGYKLTYMGYDFLAIKSLVNKGMIKGFGRQIGVGKESDVFEVIGNNDQIMVLKVHRLGRICFRKVKEKRDYLGKRKHASFMYMSKLAAVREFAYLKALYDEGFPTPIPYEMNRHCILMSKVDGSPMVAIGKLRHPQKVYNTLMNLIVQLAQVGLVHGDFNEFNILISTKDESVTMIDFPQMISTTHVHAQETFERDVNGVHRFFLKKLGLDFLDKPRFVASSKRKDNGGLDIALKASGALSKREAADLDAVMDQRETLLAEYDEDDAEYDDDEEADGAEEDEEEDVEYDPDAAEDEDAEVDHENEEEEEEEEEPSGRVRVNERKMKHVEAKFNPSKQSANRKARMGMAADDDEEGAQVLLTAAQLEGLDLGTKQSKADAAVAAAAAAAGFALADDDDDENLDDIPTLTDDDDEAENDDEDEDDEDDESDDDDDGQGKDKPARRRKVKAAISKDAVRAKVQRAKEKKRVKDKFKAAKNPQAERRLRRQLKDVRDYAR